MGVDDPCEPPPAPDLTIDTTHFTIPAAIGRVMALVSAARQPAELL
jgi:hypothetical protein